MTALTPQQKERQREARSRAGHIRYGMQVIGDTWIYIARARAEGDHLTLGYETWEEYVDGEFGEDRVKLPAGKRAAAVAGLIAVGLTQREAGHALGLSAATVNRALAGPVSNETGISDTDADSPADPPLVDAIKQALVDADERAEDHRASSPGEGFSDPAGTSAVTAPKPGVAAPVEEVDASRASSRASSEESGPVSPGTRPGSSHDNPVPPMPAESYALVRDMERRAALVGRVVEALEELMEHAADPAQLVAEVLPTMRHRLAVIPRAHAYLTQLVKELDDEHVLAPVA